MDNRNRRTAIANIVRAVIALFLSNALGYILYMLILNSSDATTGAKGRLIVFSFATFLFSFFVFIKIFTLPTKDERKISEAHEIAKRCVDSDYNFDFKEYFKEQIKRRLWGVPIVLFISNLPLVVIYIMVEMAEGFTIYTSPISVYKFSMTSMFLCELLGEVWFFAPIFFPLFFFFAFSIILYFYEKTFIPAKPSWKE